MKLHGLKLDFILASFKLTYSSFLQLKKILLIFITCDVLNLDKSKKIKDEQSSNNLYIDATENVSKLDNLKKLMMNIQKTFPALMYRRMYQN